MQNIKLVLALVIAGGWLSWGEEHAAEALQSVTALNIGPEARPVIDGRLVEDFWQNCQTLDLNSVLPKTLNKQPTQHTTAKIATDGAWLFVGFTVEDKTLLDASLGQAGLSFMYDCVEFYLDPGTGGERFFRFGANRFGRSRADQKGAEISHMSYPCNIHWRAAGAETTDGWSVEMAIPLFRLAELDGAGPDWRVNFCRADTDPAEATSWAPVHKKFAEPELFGRLVFSPPDLPSADGSQPFAPHLTYVQAGPTTDQTGEYVSAVRIGLAKGHADAGGIVNLELLDESIPEKPVVITTNLTLAPDKQQFGVIMTLKRPLEFIPQPEVTLSVQDDMGSWSQTMAHGQGVIEESYSAWLDRSYYTSEKQAMLYIQSVGKAPANATVNVISADERLRPAPARLLSPGVWSVAIPLSELPPGKYALDVQVEDSGVSAPPERQFVVLSKLPPASAGHEVKIDRYNRRLLVDEQPFFPLGFCIGWTQPRLTDLEFAFLKELGFNTVMRFSQHARADGKRGALAEIMEHDSVLAAAKNHDIMVIEHPIYTRQRDAQNRRVWLWEYPLFVDNYYDWKTNELPVVMNVATAHPSVLSYLAMDEPSNVLLQPGNVPLSTILNDLMEALNQMDPYKPVFLTFGGLLPDQMEWLDKQTWFATFNYWLVKPDSTEHARNLVKVLTHNAKVAAKHNKPLVLIPTTEINWTAQEVPMTAAENRAQLYILLVHDAKGIIYYVWPWRHVATDACLAELAQEVQTLAPALMRRRPAQRVVYDTNGGDGSLLLSALIVEPDDTPLLMILNADNAPVRFNCSLPWLNGDYRLTSCFDDAHAELKNGSFQADLGRLSSRVYRITGAAITNTWEMHDIAIRVEQDSDDAALANLIPDASFNNPAAWLVRERDAGRVNFIDTPGETSGRLVVLDGAKGGGLYLRSSPIPLRPYHRYRMSATFRYANAHSGTAASMALREADNIGGVTLPGVQCGNPKQLEWQTVEHVVQAHTEHPSSVRMLVYWDAPAGGNLSFKEIILQDLGPVAVTESLKNRVPNPGFENARLPGWPDYWQTRYMDDSAMVVARLGTEKAAWRLDENNPHSGRVSLRMEPLMEATVSTPFFRVGRGIPAEEGRTFDFTAWLRAENEQIPVRVIVRGIANKTFKVGREWTKVELSGVKTNAPDNRYRDFTTIYFSAPKGTIWIDDVCLTEREPAAEKAVDAPSDKKD